METIKKTPYIIYAEMTPNPATMKFVANKLLVDDGSIYEYTDPSETKNAPLAEKIFNFPFVTGVFISNNFITVTKNNLIEWEDVTNELRIFIYEYLSDGKPVFKEGVVPTETFLQQKSNLTSFVEVEPKTELEKKIVEILEDYVRPAVESDGGAINFKSFVDGVVTVVLRGSCSGCPSSTQTLKSGIENMMRQMVPEVKEVVAESL
jgi:NFU1 iron-sulfur cluster scaffold homolog, mitochondrial